MKQRYILTLPLIVLLFSCGSDDASTTDVTVPSSTTPSAPIIPATTNTAPVNTVNIPAQPTSAKLNPAHGQPGHRCDIEVGAPLDSKPTQPSATISQPVMSVDNSSKVSVSPASSTLSGNGLNPEHGKPGHRCDLAVGARLDSKPQQ